MNWAVKQPKGFPSLPEGWKSEWETYPSSDHRLQLFSVTHEKSAGGHRALMVVHGLGEHGGRYLHFPYFLQSEVDRVVCADLRGHGRSEGIRGHIERFDLFADDIALAVRRLDERLVSRYGKSEIHLFGHSLGGQIVLRTLFLNSDLPLSSVTVTAPLLAIRAPVPAVKKAAAFALSRLWGSLQLDTELDVSQISRDPLVVDAYATDRLVHSKMTPRFFSEMQAALADTLSRGKRASGIQYAVQFLVPSADQLVNSEVTQEFFQNLKQDDKRLKTYPGFFHEPFNEPGKAEVFDDIASWIAAHHSATDAVENP